MSMTPDGMGLRKVLPSGPADEDETEAWPSAVWADGTVRAWVPLDPYVEARRDWAMQEMREGEKREVAAWELTKSELPARSECQPPRWEAADRRNQDLSLGRRPRGYLWRMPRGVYLRTLAGLMPILRRRLSLMGEGYEWSTRRWLELTPVLYPAAEEDALGNWPGKPCREEEEAAALFLVLVADGRGSLRGREAGAEVMAQGLRLWRSAERGVFARWCLCPFRPCSPDFDAAELARETAEDEGARELVKSDEMEGGTAV